MRGTAFITLGSNNTLGKKREREIKKYIFKNCEIGDKTLTVQEFAEKLNVSTNTVRRAIKELINQGFLHIQRGRFGGIYVTDFPEDVPKTYKWLALN